MLSIRGACKKTIKRKNELGLKLLAELMRNSRQSDRSLARKLNVSQPTVTRLRNMLEKERYIKEYTAIPDFAKLGYELMGVTLVKHEPPMGKEQLEESRKAVIELEGKSPYATLMAVSGMGFGKDRLFINFYESYSDFDNAMSLLHRIPYVDVKQTVSFLVSLKSKSSYKPLTMAAIANNVCSRKPTNK